MNVLKLKNEGISLVKSFAKQYCTERIEINLQKVSKNRFDPKYKHV